MTRLSDCEVETVAGGAILRLGSDTMPLRALSATLAVDDHQDEAWVVVVESGRHRWAFTAAKPLGDFLLLRRPIDRIVGLSAPISASAAAG